MVEKVIIMGAAGRDFHNFNIYFKNNPRYHVICFTAAQIPNLEGRIYPPELAGDLYPKGIPVYAEEELPDLIKKLRVDLVTFSYSDVSHKSVMHKASLVMAHGADFILIGAAYTMLKSEKPVVAVCAVRTGCGKSQTSRKICEILKEKGKRVVVVRHPMPYGDLKAQVVQRFSARSDFKKHNCTIEEMEEYEPLVDQGIIVYAGVDYARILKQAEKEADVIIWDGGNNDTPFFQPDIHIVLFDPHRAGDELLYYPGETNMIMSDIAIINKVDSAPAEKIQVVRRNIEKNAPDSQIILAESPVIVDNPELIENRTVLVVEDGPTITHGGMSFGAGAIAAEKYNAAEVVDPRPYAHGTIRDTYAKYPHIGSVLPAVGYSSKQLLDLEITINNTKCDLVLFATPVHLSRIISIKKPVLKVGYEYKDHDSPTLKDVLLKKISRF
ncbi:MAG TPA: GTPase [Desulfobacteraceae bacterium]|nr:GTPase [Desulfobacteraceae bacterium]